MVSQPCNSGRPHSQDYMDSTNWIDEFNKTKRVHKVGWIGKGVILEVLRRGECDQNTLLTKIPKDPI